MKRENETTELKKLFNAFTQVSEDEKEADMNYAFASQQELALKNETNMSATQHKKGQK